MAAMKPRTGDGPLEVTKEGRGIVMRVPLEGGGRLVVELNADEASALGDALKTSSADVTTRLHFPPGLTAPTFAAQHLARPHAIAGVDTVAAAGAARRCRRRPDPCSAPVPPTLDDALGSTCSASPSCARLTGRPSARSPRCPVPAGTAADPRAAAGPAGRCRRRGRRATCGGPVPRSPRATRDRGAVADLGPCGRRTTTALDGRSSSGSAARRRFGFHWRSTGPEHRPVAPGRSPPAEPLAGADRAALARADRDRRRRLARPRSSQQCRPTSRTPPGWPTRPSEVAAPAGLDGPRLGRERARREGFGGILGVGRGSATPPRLIRLDYTPRRRLGRKSAARRARRQGHHVRHRRPLDQARPRHDRR